MPDIVSRIRVEAQGADQAAREIRKLKEAYDQVAASARGISPTGVAGGDAFEDATTPPPYPTGQTPSDIADRETRKRNHDEQVREREKVASARTGMGTMGRGMSAVEQAGAGRAGGAFAELSSGLGATIGGVAGIGFLAGGLALMGIQKFADNAYERMESIWGAGISQRLGRSYEDIQNVTTGYARTGIPMGMVQQYFSAASSQGLNMDRTGALGATSTMMEAMATLGVDPSAAAGVLGAMSRGNVDLTRFAGDRGFAYMGQINNAFGRENVGMYLQEMARGITSMTTRGIDISEDALTRQTNMLGAYRMFGDFTAQGAVAMQQKMGERGIAAAQLQRPEDIIAFQRMQRYQAALGLDTSLSGVQLAMEQNPNIVNYQMYEYLRTATGGDQELIRQRMQRYMGEGTLMSEVVRVLGTFQGLEGMTPEEVSQRLGQDVAGDRVPWSGRTKVQNEDGSYTYIYDDPSRHVNAIKQAQMLKGVEETMLELTTGLQEVLMELFTGPLNRNAYGMSWEGYKPGLKPPPDVVYDPHGVVNAFEASPEALGVLQNRLSAAGRAYPKEELEYYAREGWGESAAELMQQLAHGMLSDTQAGKERGERGLVESVNWMDLVDLMRGMTDSVMSVETVEEFNAVLQKFIADANKVGYILTDENLEKVY